MIITVLSGSPKGDVSVTMQYVAWLAKQFPQHQFNIRHVASRISKLEREAAAFEEILDSVRQSDAVLWAYPLYVMMVHGDYKRFIELIFERHVEDVFFNKPAFQLATSIHFFDHTAIAYMNGICDDLGMRSLGAFSAEMQDLNKLEKRQALKTFLLSVEAGVQNQAVPTPKYTLPERRTIDYTPAAAVASNSLHGKRAIILADGYDPITNLGKLIDGFRNRFDGPVELVDLDDIPMKGGCLGCIHCGFDNQCVYGDSDGVIPLYERLRTYDIIVYALTIRDRYFSARWKRFVDRRFYRTHQPLFENAQMAYLISGPLQQLPMLRQIIDAGADLDGTGLIGIATDEADTSEGIDRSLDALCHAVEFHTEHALRMPATFLGVGGNKLFRDEMWGNLRPIFQADHRYYKAHGYYDFPQKNLAMRLRNLFAVPLLNIPPIKRWAQKHMKENMIRGYQAVLNEKQ